MTYSGPRTHSPHAKTETGGREEREWLSGTSTEIARKGEEGERETDVDFFLSEFGCSPKSCSQWRLSITGGQYRWREGDVGGRSGPPLNCRNPGAMTWPICYQRGALEFIRQVVIALGGRGNDAGPSGFILLPAASLRQEVNC